MKYYVLLIFFIVSYLNISAQSYLPADANTKLFYSYVNWDNGDTSVYKKDTIIIDVQSDTIVNGNHYFNFDSYYNPLEFIRGTDSAIYMYDTESAKEILLFDFTQPADSSTNGISDTVVILNREYQIQREPDQIGNYFGVSDTIKIFDMYNFGGGGTYSFMRNFGIVDINGWSDGTSERTHLHLIGAEIYGARFGRWIDPQKLSATLQIGNQWVFEDRYDDDFWGVHTVDTVVSSISGDTLAGNGMRYFKSDLPDFLLNGLIRVDTAGIHIWDDSADVLVFRFDTRIGDHYDLEANNLYSYFKRKEDLAEEIFGLEDNAFNFWYDNLGGSSEVVFSPKFGFTYFGGSGDMSTGYASSRLIGCRINGQQLGVVLDVDFSDSKPSGFSLSQNYPNPFNPSTIISFAVPEESIVRIVVYNSLGERISVIFNRKVPAGNYKVNFDGSDLPSGVYFYSLQSKSFAKTNKMLLLR